MIYAIHIICNGKCLIYIPHTIHLFFFAYQKAWLVAFYCFVFAPHSETKLNPYSTSLPFHNNKLRKKSQTIKEQGEKKKVGPELRDRVVHKKQNLKTGTKYEKKQHGDRKRPSSIQLRKESKRRKYAVAGEKSSY